MSALHVRAKPSASPISKDLRVLFARNEGFDHRTSRYAHHVCGYRAQLEVGVLERLVDAVRHRDLLVSQLGPLARQLTQFPQRWGGHEAPSEQAVLQQFRQPFGVLDVRLASWHASRMLVIAQYQHKPIGQQAPRRLPGRELAHLLARRPGTVYEPP